MCGLVALIKEKITIEDMKFMHQSVEKLAHRGPDEQRIFYNDHLVLGFNRLSIRDIEKGGQPFRSQDGTYHLLFNGEIYNYDQLRRQLEKLGFYFETNCEAEVILALYKLIGLEFMSQLRGMFSLVLYDHALQKLIAVRDRFGIKPLYYFTQDNILLLTSELKIFKSQSYKADYINEEALQHYFTFQYIPEPNTPLKEIQVIEPGTYLTYNQSEGVQIKRYATVELIPTHEHSNVLKGQLQKAIMESVKEQLVSDVEVGCFLSGGLDSTIITTCARAFNPNLKAFTVDFEEPGYTEIEHALKTADILGINLIARQIKPEEFMRVTREVVHTLDTPVADPSCVAIYLIAHEAREHVKVILSGEGADELFGGYRIYREVNALRLFRHLPLKMKQFMLFLNKKVPEGIKGKNFVERGCTPLQDRYIGNAFVFNEAEKEKLLKFYDQQHPFTEITAPIYKHASHLDPLSQMQNIDIQTWLKGDILTKSDRLTMAHGLELRVPFLDEKVLEIAKELTQKEKIAGRQTKVLLREAFKDYLPLHVYEGHKKGYPVPLAKWLKNELYDEAKAILSSPSCSHLIHQDIALHYLNRHALGRENNGRKIWTLMTFILWYESWNIT